MKINKSITISKDVFEIAKDYAKQHGLSFSEFVELLIREKFTLGGIRIEVGKNES